MFQFCAKKQIIGWLAIENLTFLIKEGNLCLNCVKTAAFFLIAAERHINKFLVGAESKG